jgi:hypothetical protein
MNTLKELAKNIDINLANDNITKLTRIGKKLEGEEKHRPLLVTFSNDDIKRKLFKNFVRLRSEDEVTGDNESGIKNISINHDMTSQGKGRVQSFKCRGYKKEIKSQGKFLYRVRGPPWARYIKKI